MAKSGQARVLTPDQFAYLLATIRQHRHAEKNTALIQISYKLGLRVQEIALLQLKEVCRLGPVLGTTRDFTLHEILALPVAYTKGADALKRSRSTYQRRTISFSKHDFDQLVREIAELAKAGGEIKPENYYPEIKRHRGKSRDLPMEDPALREALIAYLEVRLSADPKANKTDPLFLSQKGGPYSPNTLQEHMALMQRRARQFAQRTAHTAHRYYSRSEKIGENCAKSCGARVPFYHTYLWRTARGKRARCAGKNRRALHAIRRLIIVILELDQFH